ncbi:prostate androgen-regulated mucin-like protein 1 homolog [Xyrauchen texanus]|uniref:prostate androgen-regulated mucin-like protein 1 homolog n=1 Tax=Xyrauchen texanus TaxID=154827 RepID=UPI002242C5B5|nr:prostate androgen-regulated mucin-like protein 1 homolog [Xyrauchen texanus]
MEMHFSTMVILAGWIIFGGTSESPHTTALSELSNTATTSFTTTETHFSTAPLMSNSISADASVGQTTNEPTTVDHTQTELSSIVKSTTFNTNSLSVPTSNAASTSNYYSSPESMITSSPNESNASTTLTLSPETATQSFKTESSAGTATRTSSASQTSNTATQTTVRVISNATTITRPASTIITTKLVASTSIALASTKPPSSTTSQITTAEEKNTSRLETKDRDALSSGNVAAIVIGFIAIVVILLGGAYYLKIRRSNYGRLLDDTDQHSVGNYHNPMYDG